MSNEFAEDSKKRGNEAFAAKRYEEAVVLYDKAIEADPSNYIFYNNRAAAQHELKHYDKAIEDARKALEIQDNAKSHYRIGAALWAQRKLPEAKAAFEKAVALEPANQNARDSVQLIERSMSNFVRQAARATGGAAGSGPTMTTTNGIAAPPPQGGEFAPVPSGFAGIALDCGVLVLFVGFVVSTFLVPAYARMMWNYLLTWTIAQQGLVMHHKGLLKLSMDVINEWFKHFSPLLAGLCFLALLTGVGSQLLITGFIAMYAALDLAARRTEVLAVAGPVAAIAAPYLDRLVADYESYMMMAASFEALYTFAIPLTGGTWFTLVYIQYSINRYKSDRYVQVAFSSLRKNVTTAAARFLPAAMHGYVEKVCDLLHTVARQGS